MPRNVFVPLCEFTRPWNVVTLSCLIRTPLSSCRPGTVFMSLHHVSLHSLTYNRYLVNICWITRPLMRGAPLLSCPSSVLPPPGRSVVNREGTAQWERREGFSVNPHKLQQPEILHVADVIANKSTTCVLKEFPLCLIISHLFLLSSYKLYHPLCLS